jgi:hypothetical protein
VKKLIVAMLIGMMAVPGITREQEPGGKVAIVLLAGNETNEGMSRAVHALLYARDLADNGFQVALIFEGAGTGWANELSKPENPLHKHYMEFKKRGIVEEICDYCTEQHGLKGELSEVQRKLLVGDYDGHPSIAKWIAMDYKIIVL